MSEEYIRKHDAVKKCGEWYVEEGTEEGFIGTVSQMLDMFSPADVVPVVRCKYCRYRINSDKCCHPDGVLRSKDSDFCSYGKRREE